MWDRVKKKMRDIKKTVRDRVKKKNLAILFLLLGAFFSVAGLAYQSYLNYANTPSRSLTEGYTLAPGGGGMGDKLVSEPIDRITISRYQGSHFAFGPWRLTRRLTFVRVVTIVKPEDNGNTIIEVALEFENLIIKLSEIKATKDEWILDDVSENINLLVPAGKQGSIVFWAEPYTQIYLDSDTYVWFGILESPVPLPPTLMEFIGTYGYWIIAALIALSPVMWRFTVVTKTEIRSRQMLEILTEIRDILKKPSRRRRKKSLRVGKN